MKKYLSLFFLLAFIFGSCEDFLDVPLTSNLESNYFDTENRVQRGVGAVYASLSNIYGGNMGVELTQNGYTIHPLWLLPGDDLTNSGTNNPQYEAFSGLAPGDPRVEQLWQKYYFMLARANFMLEKLEDPDVSAAIETPGLAGNNKGEVLFLRAYVHYKLWDYWRKAPLMDHRIPDIDEAVLPPSSGFGLLDAAIADLNLAAELLPDSWDENNKGRAFKNSAYGLLVKCHVMRACYASQYGGDMAQDYDMAITAFENISGSVSTIEGVHFAHNFDYRTENNDESLFEYQASHSTKSDNPWLDNDFGGPSGSVGVVYHQFDSHWGSYTCGGGVIGPTDKLVAAFDPQDPRMAETCKMAEDVDNVGGAAWWLGSAWEFFNGYQFVKYINGERGFIYDQNFSITSSNNPRILRFADVKLAVAEAYLQTGDATSATRQVNDVRGRARLSTADGSESPVPADYTADVTMQDIMDERLLELAGEDDIRWTDLRRWHVAGYIDLANWTAADFGYPNDPALFEFQVDKNLLLPIPYSEISSNPLMMASGNNPGYN